MQVSQFHPSRDRKTWHDYIALGLIGQTIGGCTIVGGLGDPSNAVITMGNVVIVLATAALMFGLARMAEETGRTKWWGLLALLSFAGYLVVTLMVRLDETDMPMQTRAFEVICDRDYRRDVWRMEVTVKIDPAIANIGNEASVLQLPRGASVKAALKTLAGVMPELGALTNLCCTINGQRATMKDEMSHGDVLWVGIQDVARAG